MPSKLPRRRAVFAWDMHYKCNFRCEYCFYTVTGWEALAEKTVYKSPEEWEAIWRRVHDKYGRGQLRVTAGEPFTYPRFAEVVARVSRLHDMQVTTNCACTPVMREFARTADPAAVELDCTFHPLSAGFEDFAANVLLLREAGFVANVCFLAYPPLMPGMAECKRRFAERGIYMNLAVYWGEHEGKRYPFDYTDDERRMFADVAGTAVGPETVGLEPLAVRGKVCGAGQRYAVVQADGEVYRCGQLCEPAHRLGSVFDEDFALHAKAEPCPAEYCRCKEYQSAWEEEDAKLLDQKGKVAS